MHKRIATLTLGLLLAAGTARAEPALPPEPAVNAALDAFPGVEAARARITAAQAAGTMLRIGSHEVTLGGSFMSRDVRLERRYDEFDGTLTRAFRLPGKAALDRKAGDLGVDVAENRMEDSRHQAALVLAGLWFDWLEAGELNRTDLATTSLLAQSLRAVQRRAELRDASQLEVDQARAALDQARAQGAASAADMEQARITLAATFPDLPLPVEPPALGSPDLPPAGELERLRDLVISRSHEIRASDKEAQRLATLAERARKDRIADPTLGLRAFSERSGMERGLGMTFSIPLGGGYRKAEADQAMAQASAGMLDLAVVRREVEATARADMANARNRVLAWQGLAAAAQSASAAAERTARGQELGAIDLADTLAARRLARDAERQEIAARSTAIRALVKLKIDSHVIWVPPGDTD
jgi:outer membrane protein TolC